MAFSTLLGNEQLKNRLTETFAQGKQTHSYLITGPDGSGKKTLAMALAAAFQCTAKGDIPCGHCPECRRVGENIHPDVITVDDPAKVQVSVELIRDLQAQAYIRPNQGKRKIFYIPRAGQMLPPAQNALLKLMEEPPTFGAFILVAPRGEALLPTIRSRCATLRMSPLENTMLQQELSRRYPQASQEKMATACGQSGGFLGQAMALMEQETLLHPAVQSFAQAYGTQDDALLFEIFAPLEKLKRPEILEILNQMRMIVGEALLVSRGGQSLYPQAKEIAREHTSQDLFALCGQIQSALADTQANVNPGNVTAHLHTLL